MSVFKCGYYRSIITLYIVISFTEFMLLATGYASYNFVSLFPIQLCAPNFIYETKPKIQYS